MVLTCSMWRTRRSCARRCERLSCAAPFRDRFLQCAPTEDGPGLFGKGIHGTFWIPQHLRGKVDHGVVASNYKVNGPKV